ncbi:MAG: DNA repair protein RecN [Fulvivirga sp.]|nr:DNA repair protein RecN [Fulvivirga sp.]
MLTHLLIKNYALIEHLELTPSAHLNIITGETGAGKSIMLGAVGLLLGNRADTKVILHADEKCVIEGKFDISAYQLQSTFEASDLDYDQITIFRREISPSGKSRAFINDTPVTLDVIKKIGGQLVDVHSQHETLHLGKQTFQLAFIDACADAREVRKKYNKAYKAYKKKEEELESLKNEATQIAQEADYNNFLLDELNQANLDTIDQEQLEQQLKMAEHAEEIKLKLNEALEIASRSEFATVTSLQQLRNLLMQTSKYADKFKELQERTDTVFIELNDIIREIENEEEQVVFDPQETQRLQDQASMLYSLQQKHGVSDVKSLLEIRDNLAEKAEKFINIDADIAAAAEEVESLKHDAQKIAEDLSNLRAKSFKPIEKELVQLLGKVGIPEARIDIAHETTSLSAYGIDNLNILFSANKGIAPQPVKNVASGGEYSRLMFCVKYILADKISLPSIIFDEIDTGVSGEIALKLGDMMKEMADNHQVITISHLPQIAAKGDQHYFVYKDSTADKSVSKIRQLSSDDRIAEIAKMIGGDKPSEVAYESAKELMKAN